MWIFAGAITLRRLARPAIIMSGVNSRMGNWSGLHRSGSLTQGNNALRILIVLLSVVSVVYGADQCDSGISAVRRASATGGSRAAPGENARVRPTSGMTRIPGGDFWMGSDHADMEDAQPVHRVHVDAFWMD